MQLWQVYRCPDCGEEFAIQADKQYPSNPYCPICGKENTQHIGVTSNPNNRLADASTYDCDQGCGEDCCTFALAPASDLYCPNCGSEIDGDTGRWKRERAA